MRLTWLVTLDTDTDPSRRQLGWVKIAAVAVAVVAIAALIVLKVLR